MVRQLYAAGALQGSYDSNEESLITGWYTGGALRCADDPRYTIVAWRPQDEEPIRPREELEQTQQLRAVVRVDGQEKLWVYDREVLEQAPWVLDDGPIPAVAGTGERLLPVSQALELPLAQQPLDVAFEDGPRLVGVDVQGLSPGGAEGVPVLPPGVDRLGVTLDWDVAASPARDYDVALVAQGSDAQGPPQVEPPGCGAGPMSSWESGQRVFDGHVVPLYREIMGPGEYSLQLALIDPAGGRASARVAGSGADAKVQQVELLRFRVEGR